MLFFRDSAKSSDTPRGSGDRSENGGKQILLECGEEHANVAILKNPLSWSEA